MSRKDLLIVHQGALGDFVVAFPILRRLREKFRRIHALCKGGHGALAKMLNLVDGSHPLEAARFASLYTDHVDPGVKEMLADYGAILLFTWSRGLERTVVKTVGRGVAHRVSPRPGPWERMHV
ncbi:MAG: glycosyltransferase family 9 protein, partial [Desulfobacterales bacterium]|nr:glycosyltransferase family 9 protein [Desulfobacterales bacterium]